MDDRHSLTRRSFLGIAGTLPFAWTPGRALPAWAVARIPVALQLYSVRGRLQGELRRRSRGGGRDGLRGVEFAGYYNYAANAAGLAAKLKALNLKAAGTHVGTGALRGDALKATIDFHQGIGCHFLVVPATAAFTDPEKSKALAEEMNAIAATLKPLGMATGYHNHVNEFKKDGDKTFWDLFAERTSKDIILQQDCGWTMAAATTRRRHPEVPGPDEDHALQADRREGDTGKKAIFGQDRSTGNRSTTPA